jgi:glycosyltransferase involved in cell wall biosynthesis
MTRILYLAPVDWSSIRQRPQQLALRLARHFDVSYVDPVGLRSARLADAGRMYRRATPTRQPMREMPLIRPRYVPILGHRLLDRLNRRWLLQQLAEQFDFGGEPWILWLGAPSLLAESLLADSKPALVVYDCMDRYAAFHQNAARRRIEVNEAAIVRRADIVFASSHGLAERLEGLREVTIVPNGVETNRFAIKRGDMPGWKRDASGPIIGFFGTIGDWLDFELLLAVARLRPDWTFVFAGPRQSRQFDRLRKLPNVRYLGVLSYDELPQQAAWFDVALVPFRLNTLTRYVHPIKVLEYLAIGLPVVSTRLPDLKKLSNVVAFASSPGEWLATIERALSSSANSFDEVEARRRVAAAHDWNDRVDTIVSRLVKGMRRQPLERWLGQSLSDAPVTLRPGITQLVA